MDLLQLDLQTGAPLSRCGENERRGGEILDGDADRLVQSNFDRAGPAAPTAAHELAGIDPASVAELGELVNGSRRGRATPVEITLYKSVGVAVQDLAAAALVLAAAREREVGLEIELEEIHA